jgi:hypothetical protein
MAKKAVPTIGAKVICPPRPDGIQTAHEGETWEVIGICESLPDFVTLALVSDPSVHCGASFKKMIKL